MTSVAAEHVKCTCTITPHERQENRACPAHFPAQPEAVVPHFTGRRDLVATRARISLEPAWWNNWTLEEKYLRLDALDRALERAHD